MIYDKQFSALSIHEKASLTEFLPAASWPSFLSFGSRFKMPRPPVVDHHGEMDVQKKPLSTGAWRRSLILLEDLKDFTRCNACLSLLTD